MMPSSTSPKAMPSAVSSALMVSQKALMRRTSSTEMIMGNMMHTGPKALAR